MIKENFDEKITLILSFLILNNYLLLSLSFSPLLIKINFVIFLVTILVFYFNRILENSFLKVFFLFILFIALGTPTFDWDPRSVWLFHAKRIFFDNSIFSVFDNYAEFSRNDYPNLAPAFASSFAKLIGYWNEVFPKVSFLLMFLPPLIFTYVFLKDTLYLIFLSIVFFIIGKFLFNGWMDGLVAIYFCLSALLMYLIVITDSVLQEKKLFFYLIAFCFFITLTLLKNEGLALLIILFTSTILIKLFKKDLSKNISKLIVLSLSFIPIIFWKYFCYSNGIGNDYINESFMSNLLPRIYELDNYRLIAYFLLLNEKFLISLAFFFGSFLFERNKELFKFIFVLLVLYIFVLFFIYLSTPHDFQFQLDSTAARVTKSLSFLIAFFALFNLKDKKTKF